jgi:hypothetical protein
MKCAECENAPHARKLLIQTNVRLLEFIEKEVIKGEHVTIGRKLKTS